MSKKTSYADEVKVEVAERKNKLTRNIWLVKWHNCT